MTSKLSTTALIVCALIASVLATATPAAAQTPTCNGKVATIVGTEGDDVIIGTDRNDVIVALGGNDVIRSGRGRDTICGGDGRDRIFGGKNADTIYGGNDGDRINGDAGVDTIYGEQGNDRIIGGLGDDILDGGRGRRDRLIGRDGTDTCNDNQSTTIRFSCELPAPPPPENGFTYTEPFSPDSFTGVIHGWLPLTKEDPADAGRCVGVVGTLTPTAIEAGVASSAFSTPQISLISEGNLIDDTIFTCDETPLEDAGFQWILDVEGTVGTSIGFHVEFLAPADLSIDSIVVGSPNRDGATVVPAEQLTSIPTAPSGIIGGIPKPLQGPNTSFDHAELFSDSTFDGTIRGMALTPQSNFANTPAECVTVFGTLTPTAIDEGVVSNPFDTPNISLIIDGVIAEEFIASCDFDPMRNAGHEWILDGASTVGTTYSFFDTFALPPGSASRIDAILVGDHRRDTVHVYQPTNLGAIPAP